tara:strand:- start:1454 stop:1792 length:339 start_codon:yes stop_codon:yes gene_type:complete
MNPYTPPRAETQVGATPHHLARRLTIAVTLFIGTVFGLLAMLCVVSIALGRPTESHAIEGGPNLLAICVLYLIAASGSFVSARKAHQCRDKDAGVAFAFGFCPLLLVMAMFG